MIIDYDLSQLEVSQANLWIVLQADAIRAEILADQIDRAAYPDCRFPMLQNVPPVSPS